MYKVFSGEKRIVISYSAQLQLPATEDNKKLKVISFQSSAKLAEEYNSFKHSARIKELIVTGDEKKIWKVFCDMFFYLEAGGGAVINENNDLLMIFRNGCWDLPKGKTENGETLWQTAMREVQEECGIMDLTVIQELPQVHHIYLRNEKEYLKRTCWFKMLCKGKPELIPQISEGITGVKWTSRGGVKKILPLVYPSIKEILTSVFCSAV